MDSPSLPSPSADDRYARFVQAFLAREPRLRAFLRTLLPVWEDVDDALQETSLVAWRKFDQTAPGADLLPWLLTIARFEALKIRRRYARSPLIFSEELLELLADEGASEAEQLDAERRALAHCLEKLEPGQRELLERSYQPGVKFHEVAAQAGRSATGFYKVIQRLRAALLECIERRLPAEGAA